MILILGTVFAGLVGLAFGSFLNVCLTRWPAGESVAAPRSHCRSCGRTLTWWENIPVLSWMALRGRCRTCGVGIGWRYPLVELAVGSIWTIIVWPSANLDVVVSFSPRGLAEHFGTIVAKMLLTWLLVGLAALDVEHLWLPDVLTLPGIAIGAAATLLSKRPLVFHVSSLRDDLAPPTTAGILIHLALAIVVSTGLILLIRWIYWLVRRREGIGLGDAKLMAMLAAWLGLPGALLAFAIGVIFGAVVGLAILARPKLLGANNASGVTQLPLGTFLCIGGIVSALWGQPILAAYLRWAGFN